MEIYHKGLLTKFLANIVAKIDAIHYWLFNLLGLFLSTRINMNINMQTTSEIQMKILKVQ
jgi:hypothetical protein